MSNATAFISVDHYHLLLERKVKTLGLKPTACECHRVQFLRLQKTGAKMDEFARIGPNRFRTPIETTKILAALIAIRPGAVRSESLRCFESDMNMKVDVVAHLHAIQGREEALRCVLESFVGPTRKEQGCLRYDLYVDVDSAGKFTFIEEWESRQALDKHGQSEHIAKGRAQFPELLAQPAWVQVLTRIA